MSAPEVPGGGARPTWRAALDVVVTVGAGAVGAWAIRATGASALDLALLAAEAYAALLLHVAAHEASHALVAMACGLAVSDVRVGSGGPLGEFRVGAVAWRFRRVPLGGCVRYFAGRPWKTLATSLAGPLLPMAAAACVGWWPLTVVATVGLLNLVPRREGDGRDVVDAARAMRAARRRRRERGAPRTDGAKARPLGDGSGTWR